jgi:hypothetical protein
LLKGQNAFLLYGALEGSEGGSNASRGLQVRAGFQAGTWWFVKEPGA